MEARERVRKLLVLGDNRLKQGDERILEKARAAYEEALAVAREADLEAQVGPLVRLRLEEIERLKEG